MSRCFRQFLIASTFLSMIAFSDDEVQAQGIPVIDGANYSQALLDKINQLAHEGLLLQQWQQMIADYETALRNAIALGDMDLIFDLRGFLHDAIYSDLGETIFAAIYGLDPNSPTYANDAVEILRGEYNLPTSNGELEARLGGHFYGSDLDRQRAQSQRTERDVRTLGDSHQILAANRQRSEDYKVAIGDAYEEIMSVPEESLQRAVSVNGTATLLNASINQTQLDMAVVEHELNLLRETRRLEQEEDRIQRRLRTLEQQSAVRNAPYSNFRKWDLK